MGRSGRQRGVGRPLGQWKRWLWGSGLIQNSRAACLAFIVDGLHILVVQKTHGEEEFQTVVRGTEKLKA